MDTVSQQELIKLVSLYKSHCKGELEYETVINEMLDIKLEIDKAICHFKPITNLTLYYSELEYLLFDIMGYDKRE